ncbi:MAG: signal recognition particle protein [Candidatus Muirbacterium halophilum]|nr:signal recognition particle protein [Candidatus Muirbacterium halophilum]MCK9475269.1 signal recognition particle protein [Candidatus Muirbacterium halophilum]
MMFENLTEKLGDIFDKLKGKGKLTEKDLDITLREVKLVLLGADVNFKVVKDFIKNVKEKSLGSEILKSLSPGHQVIKIVNEELVDILGGENEKIIFNSNRVTKIMLVGLQGSGKTTTCAKIAYNYKAQNKKILLVAADIYRPAAIKQLKVLGDSIGVEVFSMGDKEEPWKILKAAEEYAVPKGIDLIILDTAGRLHIDENLMEELSLIKQNNIVDETLLVVDAMTGQDAVNVADKFNEKIGLSGLILTKLDGDARGGAALSIKKVTGKPIKYIGVGEKINQLESFYPDRMASRILGMGDVLTLIEKAQSAFNEEEAKELEKKFRKAEFTFEDFYKQLQQIKKMGSISDIMNMIPGMGKLKKMQDVQVDEKELVYVEAIINSMTKEERIRPNVIDGSRKKRIASGAGRNVQEVNRLLKQFEDMKKMMKNMGKMQKMMGKMPGFPF